MKVSQGPEFSESTINKSYERVRATAVYKKISQGQAFFKLSITNKYYKRVRD